MKKIEAIPCDELGKYVEAILLLGFNYEIKSKNAGTEEIKVIVNDITIKE